MFMISLTAIPARLVCDYSIRNERRTQRGGLSPDSNLFTGIQFCETPHFAARQKFILLTRFEISIQTISGNK
jgi:hypothetical protein